MRQEVLDKLRDCQLTILDTFAAICKKHHLRYYLMFGTLLGAVRHHGYIPWDDDADVAMPKEDYKVFLRIGQTELGDRFFLQTCLTDKGLARAFAKIRMNNTAFVSLEDQHTEKHHGIFVDIFPMEHRDKELSFPAKIRSKIGGVVNRQIIAKREGKPLPGGWCLPLRPIPTSLLVRLREQLYDTKGDHYKCYNDFLEVSDFEPSVLLPFEDRAYSAPHNYDHVLRTLYGDYMQLPPPEERITHNPRRISFDLNGPDEDLSEE